MRKQFLLPILLALTGAVFLVLAACASGAGTPSPEDTPDEPPVQIPGPEGPAGPEGPPGPQGPPGIVFASPGPGLVAQITSVDFADDGKPVVALTLTDAAGRPLAIEDIEGFGFTVAQVVEDENTGLNKYQSLLVRTVEGDTFRFAGGTMEPVLKEATQPFADNNGEWVAEDAGVYTYTFGNELNIEANPDLTTTVALYIYKDGRSAVSNDVFTFVPAGGDPEVTREIVATETCNTCHNPLALHGGVRREVGLCITCHTDQNVDPETANVLEFNQMIHKLHQGNELPSVQAGEPYYIVGYRQSVHNYSLGTWPQDMRNCTTCHVDAPDANNFKTKPQTSACISCHDNVNMVTGENHADNEAKDDTQCTECHEPSEDEFDDTVVGAHFLPLNSWQILGVNFEILGVEAAPGESPAVTFRVTNNEGDSISPADMGYLGITLAGPTSDYLTRVTETVFRSSSETPPAVEDVGDGAYRYIFEYVFPDDVTDSYAIGLEGYVMESIDGVTDPVRVAGFNPVTYVALDGGTPVERRQIVDRELCNACHQSLALHGGMRQNTQYCITCHNPAATDEARRPEEALPPASINFRVLIHQIHRGEETTQLPVIYGFGNSEHDFSNVVFPGNLAECETCHLPGTYDLPLPSGIQPTIIIQAGNVIDSTLPVRSVCTACHDTTPVAGHAELQTTSSGIETCEVCHGPGSEFDVNTVHR